jgi:hypothetical protein
MPMDMSKLPRLSNTAASTPPPDADAPLPPADQPIPARPEPPYSEQPMTQGMLMGAEVWLSFVIGIILLLMNTRFISWVLSKMGVGQFTWTFNDAALNPMDYTQTVFFWNDLGIVLFALCMIVEGLILSFLRRRVFVQIAFGLTILAVVLNVLTLAKAMPVMGFQLMPAIAIAFGIYMAMFEWALLKASAPARTM